MAGASCDFREGSFCYYGAARPQAVQSGPDWVEACPDCHAGPVLTLPRGPLRAGQEQSTRRPAGGAAAPRAASPRVLSRTVWTRRAVQGQWLAESGSAYTTVAWTSSETRSSAAGVEASHQHPTSL